MKRRTKLKMPDEILQLDVAHSRGCGKPHPLDIHVGKKLKQGRDAADVSQMELAEAVSLTFQQIQKYEKGTNRISCSKLYRIAQALGLPIEYFFPKSEPGFLLEKLQKKIEKLDRLADQIKEIVREEI